MSPRKACLFATIASTVLASLVAFSVIARLNPRVGESAAAKLSRSESAMGPSVYVPADLPVYVPTQSKNIKALGGGKVLVASRELGDPNFVRTVILLVRYDAQGVVGLILNRRTEVPLSRVLENLKQAKDRTDPVYLGGPVELPSVFGLLKSSAKVDGAEHVFGNVYLISAKALFEQSLTTRRDPHQFHVYLGYAGWSVEQLKKEVEAGAWFIFPADESTVFNADPDSLWPRMIGRTELEMAFDYARDSRHARY